MEIKAPLGAFNEGKFNRNVVAGANANLRRVAVDEVGESSIHAIWRVQRHGKAVGVVSVVADFKGHRLRKISRDVGLTCFFIGDEDCRCFENLDDELDGVKDVFIVHACRSYGDGVETGAKADWHGQLNHNRGFAVPCVHNRRLV